MKTYLDNLRPFEKRLVVGVGAVFFVVLNFWFVVPHFSDWQQVKTRMANAQLKLQMYEQAIGEKRRYEGEVRRMEGEGHDVPPEEQSLHFRDTVQSQAVQAGVVLSSSGRITEGTKGTNNFFLDLSQQVSTTTTETNLVNFLYNLGSSNSLIRVRALGLGPDGPRHQLSAHITLVASYQKKAAPRAAPGAAQNPGLPTSRVATPASPR
jgi:hypothetical protein